MKLSDFFTQHGGTMPADCLDTDLSKDNHKFLSLTKVYKGTAPVCVDSRKWVLSYEKSLAATLAAGNQLEINRLLSIAKEQNAAKLGMSKGEPRGNGCSVPLLINSLAAIESILRHSLHPILGMAALSDGINVDRTSDLLVGILLYYLLDFTEKKLREGGVYPEPLQQRFPISCYQLAIGAATSRGATALFPVCDGEPFLIIPIDLVEENPQSLARHFLFRVYLEEMKQSGSFPENPKTGKPISKKEMAGQLLRDKTVKQYLREEAEKDPSIVTEIANEFINDLVEDADE